MDAPRRVQGPIAASLAAILLVAGGLAWGPFDGPRLGLAPLARHPVDLPGDDADRDGYGDDVDVRPDGDLFAMLRLDARPAGRIIAGTDDDHWRLGAGRELAWRHVVDVAPARDPGSPAWRQANLRTGVWVEAGPDDTILALNIRDDADTVRIVVEAWSDVGTLRDQVVLEVATDDTVSPSGPAGSGSTPGRDGGGDGGGDGALRVSAWVEAMPMPTILDQVAQRWAPTYRFDSQELFFPVPAGAMATVDGFHRAPAVLAPWLRDFNNGRDGYRLLRDDFDGDGVIGAMDVVQRLRPLGQLGATAPTVYAHVALAHDRKVVVQYWTFYFYNFVLDRQDREVEALAHAGDREFVQLRFASWEDAMAGEPESAAFSQHYEGVTLPGAAGADVFVARGSHASYPAPGDDRRSQLALRGYHDRFDGQGATWAPGEYTVELLADQPWHLGTLWGPTTRYARELGTSTRPLLQHDFTYPLHDPLSWERHLAAMSLQDAQELYGSAS